MVTLIKGQNVGEKSPLCGIPSVATSPCWLQNGVTPNYVVKQSANLSTLQCVISIWTDIAGAGDRGVVCFFV